MITAGISSGRRADFIPERRGPQAAVRASRGSSLAVQVHKPCPRSADQILALQGILIATLKMWILAHTYIWSLTKKNGDFNHVVTIAGNFLLEGPCLSLRFGKQAG